MLRKIAVVVLTIALASFAVPAQSARPVPGTTCPKLNLRYMEMGGIMTCVKSGKKLVWKITKQPTSMPNQGVNKNEGNNNGNSKNNNGGNNNNGNNSGGNNQGGSGDPGSQPIPTNGVWQTLPGYPTDLPPRGWKGEPKWFISNWDVLTSAPVAPACASDKPLTKLATDLSLIDNITPQGFMQPGAHAMPVPHMYYNAPQTTTDKDAKGQALRTKKVPVYAPADMVLRSISVNHLTPNGLEYDEYMLGFSLCGHYWVNFAHIDDLNPDIASAYTNAPLKECRSGGQTNAETKSQDCVYQYLSIKVKAGTQIGMSSGRAHGFDFGFVDTTAPATGKLDPGIFSPRWAAGRCHINYYVPDLAAQITAKLIGDNGCGQLVSDVPGTARGMWMQKDKPAQMEDFHVALAKHWSDKSLQAFSIGMEARVPGLSGRVYTFKPTQSGNNRAFELVKPGETVCYDQLQSNGSGDPLPTIYIQTTTGSTETLKIAGSTGACAANPVMPASFATFERRNTLTSE